MPYRSDFCTKLGLSLNTKKVKKHGLFSNKNVNLDNLKPVTSMRYLGTSLASSLDLVLSATDDLLFYCSANSILNI